MTTTTPQIRIPRIILKEFIAQYNYKHGELPVYTKATEKWRKRYIDCKKYHKIDINDLRKPSKKEENLSPRQIKRLETLHQNILDFEQIDILLQRYMESISEYIEKNPQILFVINKYIKPSNHYYLWCAQYKKYIINTMKYELLETSAKICLNPKRIERFLSEGILTLDNIESFYDL